jgi:hypothetical protein
MPLLANAPSSEVHGLRGDLILPQVGVFETLISGEVLLRCVHCASDSASDFNGLCGECGKFSPLPTTAAVTAPPKTPAAAEVEAPPSSAVNPSRSKRPIMEDGCGIGCALLILLGIPYLVMRQCSTPPPTAEQIKAEAVKERAEAAKVQEDERRGLHCLSGWDGSNRSLVDQVKYQLREPDSFEHIDTQIAPEVNGKHTIMMKYRARNGFGGMNVAIAMGTVDHHTCTAVLTSAGE